MTQPQPHEVPAAVHASSLAALKRFGATDDDPRVKAARAGLAYWRARRGLTADVIAALDSVSTEELVKVIRGDQDQAVKA